MSRGKKERGHTDSPPLPSSSPPIPHSLLLLPPTLTFAEHHYVAGLGLGAGDTEMNPTQFLTSGSSWSQETADREN